MDYNTMSHILSEIGKPSFLEELFNAKKESKHKLYYF